MEIPVKMLTTSHVIHLVTKVAVAIRGEEVEQQNGSSNVPDDCRPTSEPGFVFDLLIGTHRSSTHEPLPAQVYTQSGTNVAKKVQPIDSCDEWVCIGSW